MATQPTNLPVPSESPRDLQFNAGKIDEFVTSLVNTYIDRFGNEHYTIEGLRWIAQQAIAQYGWIPIGTFQAGATLTLPNQILKDTTDGEYYRWDGSFLPSGKIVPNGSTPGSTGVVGTGAWLSVGDSTLRSMLASSVGAAAIGSTSGATAQNYFTAADLNTVTALMASSLASQIKEVRTSGYYDIFGKRDIWVRSAETATPSQTPLQLNKLAVTDANGSVWYLDISNGEVCFDSIGAKGTGLTADDDWSYLELAVKNAEQGTNRVVRGNKSAYYFSKPILMKTGRHLEFNAKFGVDITYGGQLLSSTDAPNATIPVGVGYTSTFSDKQAQIVVAHTAGQFARYWSVKNCYIKNASSASSAYGIYCPFGNAFDLKSVWSVGGLVDFDARNIYTYSFSGCYFSAPTGITGTVGINVTPIQNGLGSGTSGTFERIGIVGYKYSWIFTEMNYTSMTSCYSEDTRARYALFLTRCNGMNINTYGIENLTVVSGDGRLVAIVDSQASINGLQASYNINLSGVSAITVTGNSQVTINDPFVVAVGSAYVPLQTDNTSHVRMYGFKSTGPTPLANILGLQTVIYADQGRNECVNFPGNWNGGFLRIGAIRLWDDGTGLRIKRGTDPSSVSDGTAL